MELHEFVQLVQPINMRGIVLSSSCYIDPSHYFGHCNGVCQTFQRVQHKRKESGKEHVRVVRAESYVKVNDSKRKGRKCGTVGVSGVYMSRASASRRRRRGAKIMEYNHADWSWGTFCEHAYLADAALASWTWKFTCEVVYPNLNCSQKQSFQLGSFSLLLRSKWLSIPDQMV